MKRISMMIVFGMSAVVLVYAGAITWGRKVTATPSPVAYTVTDPAGCKVASLYNSGTNDVAFGINIATNDFYTLATNTVPSVAICPPSQSLTFELKRTQTVSPPFDSVTNIVVMSYNGNSAVYITAY